MLDKRQVEVSQSWQLEGFKHIQIQIIMAIMMVASDSGYAGLWSHTDGPLFHVHNKFIILASNFTIFFKPVLGVCV